MWVFGYGSLIWKQYFPVKRQLTGHIKGFMRRFWQGSTDHRGVPGNDEVWGVAFEIPEDQTEQVRKHLDHREKCGFTTADVTFYPENSEEPNFSLLLYIATEDNPDFLGPADTDYIAQQIFSCVGPSGNNMDYLLNLATALRTLLPHVEDPHILELERKPGRVVTLIPATQEDKVWGVAFEIPEDHVDEVRAQLDHREQRYTPTHVTFYPRDARETEITLKLYIGTDTGPNYLGPAELEDIAAQIYRSEGPSGKNVDYLFNLANSLRTLMPHVTDEHVFDLEQLVLEMKRREEMQQT